MIMMMVMKTTMMTTTLLIKKMMVILQSVNLRVVIVFNPKSKSNEDRIVRIMKILYLGPLTVPSPRSPYGLT